MSAEGDANSWLQWILGAAGTIFLGIMAKLHMGQLDMEKQIRALVQSERKEVDAEMHDLWAKLADADDKSSAFREAMLSGMATKQDLRELSDRLIGEIRRK